MYIHSDFIFSYDRYLDAAWSSRTSLSTRRIDRDTRFRWPARRFESRRFARVHERRTPTTWNLLVNHRRRVDHYHPRREQISLSPCLPRPAFGYVERRVRRHWPISSLSGKKLADRFARSLSISRTTWRKTRFRSKTMTQHRRYEQATRETHRGKMARKLGRVLVFLG